MQLLLVSLLCSLFGEFCFSFVSQNLLMAVRTLEPVVLSGWCCSRGSVQCCCLCTWWSRRCGWTLLWLKRLPCFAFPVLRCHGACAEVDSDTEAVAGKGFKLGCISCKKRSEVDSSAMVEWYFRPKGEADFFHVSLK